MTGTVEGKILPRAPLGRTLNAGDPVPRRPQWRLVDVLDQSAHGEVWRAQHLKTGEFRVFKFSLDGSRLTALKRETTLSRLLYESLGDVPAFVRVREWDFDDPPYFLESDYGGPDLETWAEQRGGLGSWPLQERLAWIAEVADAVGSAHELGVLHKDLTPTNLLVYEESSVWRPRIVDFGSARLLDPQRLDALGITRTGVTVDSTSSITGTPLYVAPEVLAGQSATVKSDLYALGVILYQLVVGDLRRPLSAGWEADLSDPLLREDIAACANVNPDLRLDSVRALANRLRTFDERREAHQKEEVVKAQANAAEKALAKARARRPWAIAAFVLLALGAGISLWLYAQAAKEREIAGEKARAATAINRFLNQDFLAAADPLQGGKIDITVREALNVVGPKIDTRFAGEPDLAGVAHQTLGASYYSLADFAAAATQFRAADESYRQAEGDGSEKALEVRMLLAQTLAHGGQLDDARKLLDDNKSQVEKLSKDFPMARVYADNAEGWWAFNSLKIDQAVAPLEDAVRLLSGLPDADPSLLLTAEQAVVSARARLGMPSESLLQTQQRILAQLDQQQGHSAPMTLGARHLLARLEVIRGNGRKMEQTYIDLVKDYTRELGPENESTLLVIYGLGNVYSKLERWPECERFVQQAYDGLLRRFGPDNINTLNAQNSLAVAKLRLGKIDESAALLEDGLSRLRKQSGKLADLLVSTFEINLGHVRLAQHRYDDVVTLVADIRKNGSSLVTSDSDAAGELYFLEGSAQLATGHEAEARKTLETAVELLRKKNPPDYWIIKDAQKTLAQADLSKTNRAQQ
ncbi:MAG: tetratricopeptide repeat protein [Proteobacteria bacterium]|nr:tetratricopeptide repeat protein [Pseudomonadota bacterium]